MTTIQQLLKEPAWETANYHDIENSYWAYIRDLHFNIKSGSQFWLERAKEFKLNPSEESMTLAEFLKHKISDYDENVLKTHTSRYFIPKRTSIKHVEAHTSSGSVGSKKETYWSKDALEYAIRYGDYIFDKYKITMNTDWLVTGTILFHEIVKGILTLRNCLTYTDLIQTRSIKKLFAEAAGLPVQELLKTPVYQQRVDPIMQYFQDTMQREKINGMVAALFMLPGLQHARGFENVKTIYLSGMEVPYDQLVYWRTTLPDKTFITSYGHHQAGLCFAHPDFEKPTYYPPAPLALTYVVEPDNPFKMVKYGEDGRVRLMRMDTALLWVQVERDYGQRMKPYKNIKWDGIRDIKPVWN